VGPVGVVGASARAAVMSLARAGLSAWAVDLFADRDLARIAPCVRCPIDAFPSAIPRLTEQFPPGPVLYAGGLENAPEVVRELAARRPLWGNAPDVLERVRDPFWLTDRLHGKGFAYPRVLPPGSPCPAAGDWLLKKRHSAGGLGVRTARAGEPAGSGEYLQEFVPGPPLSAVFVADHSKCRLVGVTEQLIGEPWLHARPFHYAGTVGPLQVGSDLSSELTLLGYRLTMEAGMRGVFGVDFIPHDGAAWVVEVNPRYPASVEVLEAASGLAVLASRERERPEFTRLVGKGIYFAPHPIAFPPSGPWDADLAGAFDPWRLPSFADIPNPGEETPAGSPLLTFFVTGSTPAECRERLQSRAAELDTLFGHDVTRSPSP
jgi:predicted ATP-grasp superfamily ATP-dependent carboligase